MTQTKTTGNIPLHSVMHIVKTCSYISCASWILRLQSTFSLYDIISRPISCVAVIYAVHYLGKHRNFCCVVESARRISRVSPPGAHLASKRSGSRSIHHRSGTCHHLSPDLRLATALLCTSITMSGAGPRENIFPTRMALTNTKLRLKGAQTGHSLLAKKRDALTTRFRAILRRVDEVSVAMYTMKSTLELDADTFFATWRDL